MKNEKPEKELTLSDRLWLAFIFICVVAFAFFVYDKLNALWT